MPATGNVSQACGGTAAQAGCGAVHLLADGPRRTSVTSTRHVDQRDPIEVQVGLRRRRNRDDGRRRPTPARRREYVVTLTVRMPRDARRRRQNVTVGPYATRIRLSPWRTAPAFDDLRRRIQEDPASLAFAPLAEELRRAGRAQEAIERLPHRPRRFTPNTCPPAPRSGAPFSISGQLDEALAELTAVLAAAPEHLSALKGVAEIHRRRGEPERSRASRQAPAPASQIQLDATPR